MFKKNLSSEGAFAFSNFSAGLIACIVGYASSAVIVFSAATHIGLSTEEESSWLGVLCFFMGILTITMSLKYKVPIMFAWSTAGAALLISSTAPLTINEAYGAFVVSGFLIFIFGASGIFERVMNKIPSSLAQAMLAGILLKFALSVFQATSTEKNLIIILFFVYIFCRKLAPRYTVLIVTIIGLITASLFHLIPLNSIHSEIAFPKYYRPVFHLGPIINIGIPLFIVTMTSQNMAGIATLIAHDYKIPISKVIGWSGFVNTFIAPFGGFAINLAAITAAICMGSDTHHDHKKRYGAAVYSGIVYLFIGLFAGTVGSFFTALPKELISAISGFALLGTVTQGLTSATRHDHEKEAAMMTFFVTASGMTLYGVGSAFWGILAGSLFYLVLKKSSHSPLPN
jgi:benzoate membrane transport protein